MVVDVETERPIQELYRCRQCICPQRLVIGTHIFNEFAQTRLATHKAFRAADHVVTVRKQACYVGRRVGNDIENVPNVFGDGEWRPLQRNAQCGLVGRDGEIDLANLLALLGVSGTRCEIERLEV